MASQKFLIDHRLRYSRDFDVVFKENDRRLNDGSFLFLAKLNNREYNRLGMVISKKNVARSVDRNRVKRQIREAFRKSEIQFAKTGIDIVVLSRPKANLEDILSAQEALVRSFEVLMGHQSPRRTSLKSR